jgi:short-subunit dehydrogenase involved in D-alanine esterification of teichoic acids
MRGGGQGLEVRLGITLNRRPASRILVQGAKVVVSSRKQQNVEETVQQLRAEGLQVAGTACHVGDKAQLQVPGLLRLPLGWVAAQRHPPVPCRRPGSPFPHA